MNLIDLFLHWQPFSIDHWCLLNQSHGDVICRYLVLICVGPILQFECHEHHATLLVVIALYGAPIRQFLPRVITLLIVTPPLFEFIPPLWQS